MHMRRLAPPGVLGEDAFGATLRLAAAGMALAAGLIHLAQVGVHADEEWSFGAFFLVVGTLQLLGAVYLVLPLGSEGLVRGLFAFGIAGSAATIAIWAASRTLGLPFGAEPGEPESVGLADAAADLFELFTAWLLVMWLARRGRAALRGWSLAGAAVALVLIGLWTATRRLGIFDPDPRLIALPEFTDAAAMLFLALLAGLFAALVGARRDVHLSAPLAALLSLLLVAELSLVAFTLPARGGQNRDCRWGPLAEASGLRHSEPPDPVEVEMGETRSAVVLLLEACAGEAVELRAAEPANVAGDAVSILRFAVDRRREARAARAGPAGGGEEVAGMRVEPGRGRYPVVVDVRGEREGTFLLHAVRVDYVFRGEPGSITFASFTSFCVAHERCAHRR